ncbi:MAG: cupin domain-containing protein [Tepidisphaeraceae bacterium]
MPDAPDAAFSSAQTLVRTLFGDAAELDGLAWQPFYPGVEIVSLYQTPAGGPSAALLKYAPGSRVPRHRHAGYEHILILRGSQSDDTGTYATGEFVINLPGTVHAVWSDGGCVALLIWEKPPVLIEP